AGQLGEPGRVLLAGLVGREAGAQVARERLAHQPEEAGVDVRAALGDQFRRKRALEIRFRQLVVQVLQGVDHGPEAVQAGAGSGSSSDMSLMTAWPASVTVISSGRRASKRAPALWTAWQASAACRSQP